MTNKSGVTAPCDWCGKQFYMTQTRWSRSEHHCCCVECSANLRHSLVTEERICPVCGNSFVVRSKSSQTFCSVACQNEWQKGNVGALSKNYRRVEKQCEWCGKTFMLKPYLQNDGRHHFCCMQCKRDWYANDWSQQDEWKEKSRIRAASMVSEGRFTHTDTLPQRAVNQMLDSLNVHYINEYQFDYYAVDNYLDEYNLIIEVMGDYWHANSDKFPSDSLSDLQRKNVVRDRLKREFILKKYNIHILYLWEIDIKQNADICDELIQKYINNTTSIYDSRGYVKIRRDCNVDAATRSASPLQEDTVRTQDITQ